MSTLPAVPAVRVRLPQTRSGITHRFNISGYKGYIVVNEYPDGRPGEIFINVAKEGSTLAGLMDCISLLTSVALQHGVPLKLLCDKFRNTRFEPQGWSENKELGYATSIVDYVFRWLENRFLGKVPPAHEQTTVERKVVEPVKDIDSPLCSQCGVIMLRAGTCHTCPSCGGTSGCG